MQQLTSSILMVRPASFGYNAETAVNNAFQQKLNNSTENKISEKAIQEFDAMVKLFRDKNFDVTVIQDSEIPAKPDAVFPNNWFCTLPDGELIVFPMFAPNRRIEKQPDILQKIEHAFDVRKFEDLSNYESDHLFLEGTGSIIFDHKNKIAYACLSERTDKNLFNEFCKTHHYKSIAFLSEDENHQPIYHTNVMMHIGETYVVICLDSIKNSTEQKLVSETFHDTKHEIITISQEQVKQFAGNMIQLQNKAGEKYTILSQTAFDSLSYEQKNALSVHTSLLPVNISTIETIGGGSARCMIAEIFLQEKVN